VSVGFNADSNKGLKFSPSYRLTPGRKQDGGQAPITVSMSPSGYTVSVQADNLFAGVGLDGKLQKIKSVNAGVRVFDGAVTIQGNAQIGVAGSTVNPQCR